MQSTNASELLVEDIWYSLLYKMVVGVQLLKTSEDIDVMVEQRTVEMVKVEDGQTMFTVLHILSDVDATKVNYIPGVVLFLLLSNSFFVFRKIKIMRNICSILHDA